MKKEPTDTWTNEELAEELDNLRLQGGDLMYSHDVAVVEEAMRRLKSADVGIEVGAPTVWETGGGGWQVVFMLEGCEFCLSATRSTRKEAEEISAKLKKVLR